MASYAHPKSSIDGSAYGRFPDEYGRNHGEMRNGTLEQQNPKYDQRESEIRSDYQEDMYAYPPQASTTMSPQQLPERLEDGGVEQTEDNLDAQLDQVVDLLEQQPRADGGPRRPMNAFLIYARWRRLQLSQKHSKAIKESENTGAAASVRKRKLIAPELGLKPSDVSTALGEEWKALTLQQQGPFLRKASDLRRDFDRRHPDYKFSRGPKGAVKLRRQEKLRQQMEERARLQMMKISGVTNRFEGSQDAPGRSSRPLAEHHQESGEGSSYSGLKTYSHYNSGGSDLTNFPSRRSFSLSDAPPETPLVEYYDTSDLGRRSVFSSERYESSPKLQSMDSHRGCGSTHFPLHRLSTGGSICSNTSGRGSTPSSTIFETLQYREIPAPSQPGGHRSNSPSRPFLPALQNLTTHEVRRGTLSDYAATEEPSAGVNNMPMGMRRSAMIIPEVSRAKGLGDLGSQLYHNAYHPPKHRPAFSSIEGHRADAWQEEATSRFSPDALSRIRAQSIHLYSSPRPSGLRFPMEPPEAVTPQASHLQDHSDGNLSYYDYTSQAGGSSSTFQDDSAASLSTMKAVKVDDVEDSNVKDTVRFDGHRLLNGRDSNSIHLPSHQQMAVSLQDLLAPSPGSRCTQTGMVVDATSSFLASRSNEEEEEESTPQHHKLELSAFLSETPLARTLTPETTASTIRYPTIEGSSGLAIDSTNDLDEASTTFQETEDYLTIQSLSSKTAVSESTHHLTAGRVSTTTSPEAVTNEGPALRCKSHSLPSSFVRFTFPCPSSSTSTCDRLTTTEQCTETYLVSQSDNNRRSGHHTFHTATASGPPFVDSLLLQHAMGAADELASELGINIASHPSTLEDGCGDNLDVQGGRSRPESPGQGREAEEDGGDENSLYSHHHLTRTRSEHKYTSGSGSTTSSFGVQDPVVPVPVSHPTAGRSGHARQTSNASMTLGSALDFKFPPCKTNQDLTVAPLRSHPSHPNLDSTSQVQASLPPPPPPSLPQLPPQPIIPLERSLGPMRCAKGKNRQPDGSSLGSASHPSWNE